MTGQDLLNRMELINRELQLQSGEPDVTRGLVALNVAQDHFESLLAVRKSAKGGQTGTVVTAASTESTAFPTGVLRIDRLQVLDSNSRPKRELRKLYRTGGHAGHYFWPLNVIASNSAGEPVAYWTDGTNIYWDPLPNGVYTVRWYGFQVQADITAGGTFTYPDVVAMPLASFAVKLIHVGLDDKPEDISALAVETFTAALDVLENYQRDGGRGYEYTQIHTE